MHARLRCELGSAGASRAGSKGDRSRRARGAVDDQLRHGLAGRRRVEDAPHAVAGGNVGARETRHCADQRQAVLRDRAMAGLARRGPSPPERGREMAAHRLQALDGAGVGRDVGGIDRQRRSRWRWRRRRWCRRRAETPRANAAAPPPPAYSRNRASAGTLLPVSKTRLWPFRPNTGGSGSHRAARIDQGPMAITTASPSMTSPSTSTPRTRAPPSAADDAGHRPRRSSAPCASAASHHAPR